MAPELKDYAVVAPGLPLIGRSRWERSWRWTAIDAMGSCPTCDRKLRALGKARFAGIMGSGMPIDFTLNIDAQTAIIILPSAQHPKHRDKGSCVKGVLPKGLLSIDKTKRGKSE